MSGNPKVVIEVETHIGNVNDIAKKYQKSFKDIQKEADKVDVTGRLTKEIQQASDDLQACVDKYTAKVRELADGKLSTEEFDKFSREIESKMDEIAGRMNEAEESVNKLQQSIKDLNVDKLQSQLDKTRSSFKNFKTDVKEAMTALREFQDIINVKSNNRKLSDLDNVIEKIGNINVTSKATKKVYGNIKRIEDKFIETYDLFNKAKEKIDSAKTPKRMVEYQKEATALAEDLSELGRKYASFIDGESMADTSASVYHKKNGVSLLLTNIASEIEQFQDESSERLAEARKKITDEMEALGETAKTTVSSFTFKDGGIQIPVMLNAENMAKCRSDLEDLVNTLKNEFEENPIDVYIRLFPYSKNKKDMENANKYIKDIRAQIPEEASDELKKKLNSFIDDFQSEFQKALELNIQVNLSDTPEGVQSKIKEIQQVVNLPQNRIKIEPVFNIDPEQAEKLDEQFKSIRKDFTFDLTGQMIEMSDKITSLLKDADASAWSDKFKESLEKLKNPVKELSTLVQPLLELTKSKKGGKRGRPSKEDLENRNYIQQFTGAIDALNKALNLYDREIKHSEDIGSKLIKSVQSSIDSSNDYVLVPIEPEIDGFVEKIESALKTFKINIGIGDLVAGTGGGGIPMIIASGGTGGGASITTALSGGDSGDTSAPTTVVSNGTTVVESKTANVKAGADTNVVSGSTKSNGLPNGIDENFLENEFKNVYFQGGKSKNKGSKEEREARKEFFDVLKRFGNVNSTLKITQDKLQNLDKDADDYEEQYNAAQLLMSEYDGMYKKFKEDYPFLSDYGKELPTNMLYNNFLKGKGIQRTSSINSGDYLKELREYVSGKGDFKLNTKEAKQDFEDVVKKFIGFEYKESIAEKNGKYKPRGWHIDDLTDNPKAKKKLREKYNKLMGIEEKSSKTSKDVAEASSEVTRHSEYEGVAVDKLQEKYDRLTDKKDEYIKASEHQQVADSLTVGAEDEVEAAFRKLKAIQKIQNVMDAYAAFEGAHGGIKGEYIPEGAGDYLTYQQSLRKELDEFKKQYGVNKSSLKGIEKFTDEDLHNIAVQAAAKHIASEGIDKEISKLDYEMKYREQQKLEAEEKEREAEKKKENQENIKKAKKAVADRKKAAQENKKEKAEDKAPQSNIKQETQQIEEQTAKIEENTEKVKDNKKFWEDIFDDWKKQYPEDKSFDLTTKKGQEYLDQAVKAFQVYKENGGTRDITELSNNKKTQEQLSEAYKKATGAIQEQTKAKEDDSNSTEKLIEKYKELKSKAEDYMNQIMQGDSSNLNEWEATTKQISDIKDELFNRGLVWDNESGNFKGFEQQTQELEKQTQEIQEVGDKRTQILNKINERHKKGLIDFGETSSKELQLIFDDVMDGVDKTGKSVEEAVEIFEETLRNFQKNSKINDEDISFNTKESKEDYKEIKKEASQVNAEQKETKNYLNMSQEELQQCLASEEKWLARCKEGSEAYEKRKKNIEEINGLLTTQSQKEVDNAKKESENVLEIYRSIGKHNGGILRSDMNDFGTFWGSDGDSTKLAYDGHTYKANLDKAGVKTLTIDAKNSLWSDIDFKNQKMMTDELLEYAKKAGYQLLEILNVNDKSGGNVYGIIDDNILKNIEVYIDDANQAVRASELLEKTLKDSNHNNPLSPGYEKSTSIIEELRGKEEADKLFEALGLKRASITKEVTEDIKKESAAIEENTQKQRENNKVKAEQEQQKTSSSSAKENAEALEREKKEVSALIDELYRLEKIQDDLSADDLINDDSAEKQYDIGMKLAKYFGYSKNPLNQLNPDYYAKQYGEKYGEEYVSGIESTKPEAEQAGADLANAANDGTADAQQSHSPSRVAEVLGEYWGIGYAKGIRKHKNDVEEAVRELVQTGILTTEDLQKDLDTLTSGGFGKKYKDLREPLQNVLGGYNSDTTKVSTQLKAATTRLSKKEEVSPEQLAKYDATFMKWIDEAEKLGMDTVEFEKAYADVRAKFDSSVDDNLGEVVDTIKFDIQTLEEDNKELADTIKKIREKGRYYLGEEDVDVIQQTRSKDTKEGHELLKSYKVTGKNGSVTFDPNGRIIAGKQVHHDDYTNKQQTVNTLVKEQDKLLGQILAKEKQLGIARANGYNNLADVYQKQIEEKQRLYDENREALKTLGEEEVLQKQLIKETELRKQQEEELKEIIAKRIDTQNEKDTEESSIAMYDILAYKVKEYIDLKKQIAKGKGFDGDIEKVEKLEVEIDHLMGEIEASGLYNAAREDKITTGLYTLPEQLARIEAERNAMGQQQRSKRFKDLQGRLGSAGYDVNYELENGKPTAEFEQRLKAIQDRITEINSKPLDAISEKDIDEAETLLEDVRRIRKEGKLSANKRANENSVQKGLAQINSILSENTKRAFKRTDVYQDLVDLQKAFKGFNTDKPQSELAELTTELLKTKARFEELDNTVKGKNLFQTFLERLHGTTAQLVAQYLSWMDIIRYMRTAFTTIQQLDTALIDLRKTTSMNTEELNKFYRASTDVGKQLGVTSQEIIQQAADWSRLGYNTGEAATQMAELSSKFAVVSPGMSTEQSTDYLVSTMKAFGIETDEVERKIMDNVNRIGK